MMAAENANMDVMLLLLQHNADVNIVAQVHYYDQIFVQ